MKNLLNKLTSLQLTILGGLVIAGGVALVLTGNLHLDSEHITEVVIAAILGGLGITGVFHQGKDAQK